MSSCVAYKIIVFDIDILRSIILLKMSMLKTILYQLYREFELEAPAAEEMLDRVLCSREPFSIQMCPESGDGSLVE